ncbi:MAG: hypothetical protein KAS32_15390, partial [Candidatus Peribacteraceae bacterium]|nr:hypothetical protein [Candidatus Peribacteraceae bacterium]
RNLQIYALGIVAVVSAFSFGIHSAGEVRPAALIEAGSVQLAGDMNQNGKVDIQDAIIILEITQGYRDASATQLHADPNGDRQLTVDDALRILATLSL